MKTIVLYCCDNPFPSSNWDTTLTIKQEGALALASSSPSIRELAILTEPLQELSMVAPADVGAIKLKDEPDKAATIYEINDKAIRVQHAAAAVEAIMNVANALALKHGEILDREAVRSQGLGLWSAMSGQQDLDADEPVVTTRPLRGSTASMCSQGG